MNERPEPKLSPYSESVCGACGGTGVLNHGSDYETTCSCERESDFAECTCPPGVPKRGIGDHDTDCSMRLAYLDADTRQSPEPVVTRNAMSPDELWAMQEKPRVSDDAPDMGPIPGTEGIESDPPPCQHEPKCQMPNSPMSNEPYPPCHTEALARQSPLSTLDELRATTDRLRAERDALRAVVETAVTEYECLDERDVPTSAHFKQAMEQLKAEHYGF